MCWITRLATLRRGHARLGFSSRSATCHGKPPAPPLGRQPTSPRQSMLTAIETWREQVVAFTPASRTNRPTLLLGV
jgi:hypothetical protein